MAVWRVLLLALVVSPGCGEPLGPVQGNIPPVTETPLAPVVGIVEGVVMLETASVFCALGPRPPSDSFPPDTLLPSVQRRP
jgi:hypothetical protein